MSIIQNIPPRELNAIRKIGQVADELQLPAYIVGGIVRDLFLDRPLKDIDIVCVGSGVALAKKSAAQFKPKPKVNLFTNFGTAMFNFRGMEFEFVGARRESYRRDSRKPIVEDGTLEDDQNRRDFTINAMALCINENNFGELLDPFDGLADLEKGIIRTPLDPDITFSDDPLRMMRAIRFATQLNFTIEETSLEAIKRNAERIKIISQERITTELNKIILSPVPSIGFKLLFNTHLLDYIFPEMVDLYGVTVRNNIGHKDNFYHTIQVLDNLCQHSDNLWLRWAAILHDIAKPKTKRFEEGNGWTFHGHEVVGARMVPKIFRKLKLPMNEPMKFTQKMVALHHRPVSLTKENITDSAIRRLLFDTGDDIDELMQLCAADITSKNKSKVVRFLENYEIVKEKLLEVEEKDRIRNWQPPITGELIMETFGLKPSRTVGIIKNAIREAILDGDISNNYEEAYQFMLDKAKEMNLVSHI